MSWATGHIADLKSGRTVHCRPKGNSMVGKIESGARCTIEPIDWSKPPVKGDIVLCSVKGRQYLHLVSATSERGGMPYYQISNNKGFVNGWTDKNHIYGICTRVEQ